MHKKEFIPNALTLSIFSILVLAPNISSSLVINEKLTGKISTYDWQAINGACLTAGDATSSSSTIPACIGLNYYSGKKQVGGKTGQLLDGTPDNSGEGALRLTNGDTTANGSNGNNQSGAVYSNFDFPSNQGVNITFKTATYGGNGYSTGKGAGADGLAFFLVDSSIVSNIAKGNQSVGSFGGSLGYSCGNSKNPPDGILGGYIGLGIDEYGNFANKGDNTNTGVSTGFTPNLVTLRGAGNTNWKWLSSNYPSTFPSTTTSANQITAVQQTCTNGQFYDINNKRFVTTPSTFLNYPWLVSKTLGSSNPIYSQESVSRPTRDAAKPITYNLKITQDGLLSFSYSYNGGQETQVLQSQKITDKNGPLPSNFRFGFSSSTGGGSNVHEIMCFKAEQISGSATSAAGNVPPQGRVQQGTQLYLASYHPKNWWGQMTAQNLIEQTDGTVSINSVATWDASCVLTGGTCTSTNTTTSAQSSRRLLTWNGSAGVTLDYSNLNSSQQSALLGSATTSTNASNFLSYLKGDRSLEITTAGTGSFRARDSLLGDIINSSPSWVGAPNSPYSSPWSDLLYPTATAPEGTSYQTFAQANATRTNVVYVGSNDGFLHGFRAGASKTDGSFNSTNNDGNELIGYMPSQVLKTIGNPNADTRLNYGNTNYSHNAYVDAAPGTGDLYINGSWKTWLAGGLGGGGNQDATTSLPTGVIADNTSIATGALYLLDITNPDGFSTQLPSSTVLGEWTSNDIVCANDTSSSKCGDSLGNTFGTPLIRRLHNGGWGIIFPNGQSSKSGKSGIFVLLIDSSGKKTFRFLPAGSPTTDSKGNITFRNGISQVTSADLDGDHITDYVYAGDMSGNVWRFDLTDSSPANWAVNSTPIFNAGQPITTAIVVSTTNKKNSYRVMLNFGTGKIYPQVFDAASYVTPGTYYMYGIWDANMDAWNGKSTTQYLSITNQGTVSSSSLTTQTITSQSYTSDTLGISGVRTVSNTSVCWKNSTTCGSSNTSMGWIMALPGTNEQIAYNPSYQDGYFVVSTVIPEVAQVLSCDVTAASGFTFAILPDTGGTASSNYFLNSGYSGGVIAALGLSGVGSVTAVNSGNRRFAITQTTSGIGKALEVSPSSNSVVRRVNWVRRR